MFFGHPVERLCTYQYSLVTLMPGRINSSQTVVTLLTLGVGLLQHLEDCGSPPLGTRAPTLTRPSSLKTSNHKSMMTYLGLPLDLFGKANRVRKDQSQYVDSLLCSAGCFFPAIPSFTTAGYDYGEQELVMWDYELDRCGTERNRPLC